MPLISDMKYDTEISTLIFSMIFITLLLLFALIICSSMNTLMSDLCRTAIVTRCHWCYIQAEVSCGVRSFVAWTTGRGFRVGRVQKAVPGVRGLSWLLMRSHLRPRVPWTWPLPPPDLGFDLPKCLTSQFPTGHPLPSGQQHTYSSHPSEKNISSWWLIW